MVVNNVLITLNIGVSSTPDTIPSTGDFIVNCKDGLLLITDYEGEVTVGEMLSGA